MKQVLAQAKKIAIPSKKLQKEKTEIAKLAYSLVGKQVSKIGRASCRERV